jgi:hypothetical protein
VRVRVGNVSRTVTKIVCVFVLASRLSWDENTVLRETVGITGWAYGRMDRTVQLGDLYSLHNFVRAIGSCEE